MYPLEIVIVHSYVSLPEGKLEVPTTSKGLFFRPNFQRVSPQNMAKNMVLTYLHFRIHDNPHELVRYIYHKPCFCSAIYVRQLSKASWTGGPILLVLILVGGLEQCFLSHIISCQSGE